uniref:Uncharacterized protein n=1 Tax=Oryza sativa subsp. japonica TaxID=39947 RepID=Q9AY89_ORYSJ|nr:hypothetical protein [Oryza sativa Japonica Group]
MGKKTGDLQQISTMHKIYSIMSLNPVFSIALGLRPCAGKRLGAPARRQQVVPPCVPSLRSSPRSPPCLPTSFNSAIPPPSYLLAARSLAGRRSRRSSPPRADRGATGRRAAPPCARDAAAAAPPCPRPTPPRAVPWQLAPPPLLPAARWPRIAAATAGFWSGNRDRDWGFGSFIEPRGDLKRAYL